MSNANDTPSVGILGLGYVGLPLSAAFARAGVRVLGFDIDPVKIDSLRAGRSYLTHLGPSFAADLLGTRRFEPTSDFARLGEPDALLICVPTPLDEQRDPDLSAVERTTRAIAATLRPGQLVVLESTTYPGTTRDVVLPILEATGLRHGTDFLLAFSPERENPGGGVETSRIPKLVGGITQPATHAAATLYERAFDRVVPVSSAEVAEAAKLLENIYRAVNIAMVNEMKLVLTAMSIDVHEVIEAAATKPFGFQRFDPGPGLGGHCIPIDPFYLSWKARQVGQPTRFIELAGEVNHAMPAWVIGRLEAALGRRGRAVCGAGVLVLGLAYKKDVDDVRESPAFEIIAMLLERGASVSYHDPHVPATHAGRRHDLGMRSIELTDRALGEADAVVIVTDHRWYAERFGWQRVADHARLVIDTRNAMRSALPGRAEIVKA